MKTKFLSLLFLAIGAGNIFAQSLNDFCSNAISLTPQNTCIYTAGNTFNATQSLPAIDCGIGTFPTVLDVWYKFVATSTTHSITVNKTGSILDGPCIDLRSGACSGTNIACDGDGVKTTPTITQSGLTIGATYYIRVYYYQSQTGGTFNICVTTSSSCTLTGITPTLVSPGGSSETPVTYVSTTTPTLSWNPVSGASNYEVYVSKSPYGSANIVYQNTCVSGTSIAVPSSANLTAGTQYRWNIVGVSSCGSACSTNVAAHKYFQVQSSCALSGVTPTLVSPGSSSAPGTTISTTSPTLSWNPVSGASNYEVYVSKSPYGSANIVYQNTCVSGTSITVPSGNLTDGNLYRWNIVGVSSCGNACSTNVASHLYFQTLVTGVDEMDTPDSFAIYPNPSSGTFVIETKVQEFELAIVNSFGEKILSQKIQNEKSEIDLSNQPNGIYFISIKTEQGTAVKKIIVQK